ncbi:MAG: diphthine--ammonia ligase [Pyrobaculum sp.]
MRVAVLYSGGKDSHYALLKTLEAGHKIVCLITVAPRVEYSYMFHTVNIKWALLHGDSMCIPQHLVEVSGEKEREIVELARALAELKNRYGLDGVVSGAVASRYQKERLDKISESLGLVHITPLWGHDPEELLREEVKIMKFVITAVMAMGLAERHLGVVVTEEIVEEIIALSRRYKFSPIGEGGEYESYVVESPLVSIDLRRGEKKWFPTGWGLYNILDAVPRRKCEKFLKARAL